MEILKRFGCRILAPLLFTAAGLLMVVIVPMNPNHYLTDEENEVTKSEIVLDSDLHQPKGLIYNNVNKTADSEKGGNKTPTSE